MGSQTGDSGALSMDGFNHMEPIPLQPRFAEIKKKIAAANPESLAASWHRLLRELRREIDLISNKPGSEVIPTIDFEDIFSPASRARRETFSQKLRHRGVAIIRGVIPRGTAEEWKLDVEDYLAINPQTRTSPSTVQDGQQEVYELFWSPAQVQARAHPNMLAAQRFAMRHWQTLSPPTTPSQVPPVSAASPVTYADRIIVQNSNCPIGAFSAAGQSAHIDNGSVERWETDGYGRAGTYSRVFAGQWEDHDPWDASTRLLASPDLYGGAGRCSVFRMFQGWLSLGDSDIFSLNLEADDEGEGMRKTAGLAVMPLLKTATAYFLLRPFFSPKSYPGNRESFLSESNWTLLPPGSQTSILHGALPSYGQEITLLLHPHLRLPQSLIAVPSLNPGDYLIWHPDLIHASLPTDDKNMMLCLPACPLTQTNALYLTRQRKAFLLGTPGPDFAGGGVGETMHVGRPGLQEINEAGGEDGLRAMGLYPWDEENAAGAAEREVLEMANGILFPDRFGMAY